MKMKTNIRTFSSKKLVLGIVTTVIGISTIALVSENAYASTSTVKSQIVKNTTKPTTTVKTVKPIAVKTALCQIGLMSLILRLSNLRLFNLFLLLRQIVAKL